MTDNVEPLTGLISQSGLTNDPRPVLSGHGEVGSIIHVRVDNNEVGTVKVRPNGTWTYQLPQPLSDGLCRLSVRASNAAGQSVPSNAYMIEVDVTPPPPPSIDHASSGISATLSGHAEPYSTVEVYDGQALLGTATAGPDSQWTFQLPSEMTATVGHHALTATARDPAGNASPSSASFDYAVEGSIFEDFNALPTEIYLDVAGQRASTRYFDVTRIDPNGAGAVVFHEGLLTGESVAAPSLYISERPPTRALVITGRVRLDLHDGRSATHMSFDLGDVTSSEIVKLYFYDKSGSLIFTSPGYTVADGLHQRIDIDVGKEFTRVEINEEWRSNDMTMNWVDDIVFSGPGVGASVQSATFDPQAEQALTGTVARDGGSGEAVATVADVGGVHGGVSVAILQPSGANQVLDITTPTSGSMASTRSLAALFDGMHHEAGDEGSQADDGAGSNTPELALADVLSAGSQELLRAEGGAPGMSELAANEGRPVLDGVGYTGSHNTVQDVDLMVQAAMQTTAMA
ncbi:Ig-like domain-containing protein [Burkholderia sp. 22PA0106]|uniref:Ig-like domain-containing protein n=1 Tax=Burkholderia sp. 22PA0106 TaxID=3237371 RepID=UPI0039C2EC71